MNIEYGKPYNHINSDKKDEKIGAFINLPPDQAEKKKKIVETSDDWNTEPYAIATIYCISVNVIKYIHDNSCNYDQYNIKQRGVKTLCCCW